MEVIDRKFLDTTTPTCHASTIAFHKDKPVFAWFGGIREGQSDSSIYIQKDDESMLFAGGMVAHWNPILFNIDNELFLAYKKGEFCDRWQTYISNITNNFNTSPQIIPAGLNFAVKTKPIIKDDVIYCGSSVETNWDWSSYIEEYSYHDGKIEFKERSKPLIVDKRKFILSHPYYGQVAKLTLGIIQPSLWIQNDVMHAFFRSSRGLGQIYYSYSDAISTGRGEWSNPVPTQLDNPNSGIDTVYYDGRLFLVYNPSKETRNPLVISELDSDFNIVDEITVQEKVEDKDKTLTSELSYPYMVEHNGKLHLTYTYGRTAIEYITVEI